MSVKSDEQRSKERRVQQDMFFALEKAKLAVHVREHPLHQKKDEKKGARDGDDAMA